MFLIGLSSGLFTTLLFYQLATELPKHGEHLRWRAMCVTGGRRRCLTGAGACREDAVAIDQRGRFECFHSHGKSQLVGL